MDKRAIAFFDSGIGGIFVLSEALRMLPREEYIYYADTRHVPYGTKSKEEVRAYVLEAAAELMRRQVKALVVACNTATSIAIQDLRATYDIPIVGMEPAVKPAVELSRSTGRRVLVLATPLTLSERKYAELVSRVDDGSVVDSLALPELVDTCERLQFEGEAVRRYFRDKLASVDLSRYGTVVLGCTHYPFYRRVLEEMLPGHIRLIDGALGTVRRLAQLLAERDLLNPAGRGRVTFLSSGRDPDDIRRMETALAHMRQLREAVNG
jgi:glutamate racemase